MNRSIITTFFLMIFVLIETETFSQFDPMTNSYSKTVENGPILPEISGNAISYSTLSGVGCTDNSFWAVSSVGADLFSFVNDTIKKIGTTAFPTPFDPNLAFCNNLNGGDFSPTFYMTRNFDRPAYYDSTKIISTSDSFPEKLINCGGSGNYLFYIAYDSSYKARTILRYTGAALTPVFNFRDAVTTTVADLAVDTTGNVFFFTGANNGAFISDTLNVISPAGHLLRQYPFFYNTYNAYGSFLLHGRLYVGLGPNNQNHPNTVLPVTFTADSAIAGTPVKMPVTTAYADMASCTSASLFSVPVYESLSGIIVYPNPVRDRLIITSGKREILEFSLYDFSSKELLHETFTHSLSLNTGNLAKGTYLYRIRNKAGKERSGIVVKQ